jgi:serine/threonine protein kinase
MRAGLFNGCTCFVLQRCGNELAHFLNSNNQLSFENVHKIGIKLLTLLEQLHSIGYIHKDLKTANILVGEFNCLNSLSELKLIDFGLASQYVKIDEMRKPLHEGEHIACGPCSQAGNLAFCSFRTFKGVQLSRRDDIVSLGYLMLYLSSGRHPFIYDKDGNQSKQILKEQKLRMKPKEICSLMKCEHLTAFLEEAYAIKFKEEPNYNKLRFLLDRNLLDKALIPSRQINWLGVDNNL